LIYDLLGLIDLQNEIIFTLQILILLSIHIFIALLLPNFETNESFEVWTKVIWNFNSTHSFDLLNKLSVIVITNLINVNEILIELQDNIIG